MDSELKTLQEKSGRYPGGSEDISSMTTNDNVNRPKHYASKSGLEVIDVIEAFTEGLEGIEATDTGNILKYACRWKKKNGVEDLKKLVWYANHLINHLEKENTNNEKD